MPPVPNPNTVIDAIKRLRLVIDGSYAQYQAMVDEIEPTLATFALSVDDDVEEGRMPVDNALTSLNARIIRHNMQQDALCVRGLEPVMTPMHYSISDFHHRWKQQSLPPDDDARKRLWMELIASFGQELEESIAEREREVNETVAEVEKNLSELMCLLIDRQPPAYAKGFFDCWDLYIRLQVVSDRWLSSCNERNEAVAAQMMSESEKCDVQLEERWKETRADSDPETFGRALSDLYKRVLRLNDELADGGVDVGSSEALQAEYMETDTSEEEEEDEEGEEGGGEDE